MRMRTCEGWGGEIFSSTISTEELSAVRLKALQDWGIDMVVVFFSFSSWECVRCDLLSREATR